MEAPTEPPAGPPTLAERLTAEERRAVAEALAAERWNLTRAARRLGVSRQGLRLKLERLGIERP
jgi:two-component system response regulator HupR/HoxA